jgi:hypothetical protein
MLLFWMFMINVSQINVRYKCGGLAEEQAEERGGRGAEAAAGAEAPRASWEQALAHMTHLATAARDKVRFASSRFITLH